MADLELRTAPETDYADTNFIPFGKAAPGSGLFRGTLSALRTALLAGASLLPPLVGNAGKALFVKSDESGVEWDTVSGGGSGGGTGGLVFADTLASDADAGPTTDATALTGNYFTVVEPISLLGINARVDFVAGHVYRALLISIDAATGAVIALLGTTDDFVPTASYAGYRYFLFTDKIDVITGVTYATCIQIISGTNIDPPRVFFHNAATGFRHPSLTLIGACGYTTIGDPVSGLAATRFSATLTVYGIGVLIDEAGSSGSSGALVASTEAAMNFPDLTVFSWLNQTTATIVTDSHGSFLTAPATYAENNFHILYKAKPVGDFDVYCRFEENQISDNSFATGIVLLDSVSQKFLHWSIHTTTPFEMYLQAMNNPTTFSANLIGPIKPIMQPKWLRYNVNGTIIEVYISLNGIDWIVLGSYNFNSFFVPDSIGVVLNANNVSRLARYYHFGTITPVW